MLIFDFDMSSNDRFGLFPIEIGRFFKNSFFFSFRSNAHFQIPLNTTNSILKQLPGKVKDLRDMREPWCSLSDNIITRYADEKRNAPRESKRERERGGSSKTDINPKTESY